MNKNSKVKIINPDYGFNEDIYNKVYEIIDIKYIDDQELFILNSACDDINTEYYAWELELKQK